MITSDDFLRWREDSVTQWVFRAIEAGEQRAEATWLAATWDSGPAAMAHTVNREKMGALLIELRAQADAYRALIDTTYEGWCENNGEEPIYDQR